MVVRDYSVRLLCFCQWIHDDDDDDDDGGGGFECVIRSRRTCFSIGCQRKGTTAARQSEFPELIKRKDQN
jgi:hypothetical protein